MAHDGESEEDTSEDLRRQGRNIRDERIGEEREKQRKHEEEDERRIRAGRLKPQCLNDLTGKKTVRIELKHSKLRDLAKIQNHINRKKKNYSNE